jgi:hypothetical protein
VAPACPQRPEYRRLQHTPPQGTCRVLGAFGVPGRLPKSGHLPGTPYLPGTCVGCLRGTSLHAAPAWYFSTGTRQGPLPDKHPPGTYFPGARPAQFESGAFWVPLIRRLFSIFWGLSIFDTGRASPLLTPLCGAGSVPSVLGCQFGAMSTGAGQAPLPLRQNASIYSISILPLHQVVCLSVGLL